MQCPVCQSEMKLIPAGVSKKSGKSYNAFYSCPNCKKTQNLLPQTPTSNQTPNSSSSNPNYKVSIAPRADYDAIIAFLQAEGRKIDELTNRLNYFITMWKQAHPEADAVHGDQLQAGHVEDVNVEDVPF